MLLFQPSEMRVLNQENQTVLDCMREAGFMPDSPCGGNGTCGKCKVQVLVGEGNSITPEEKMVLSKKELEEGWRLACKLFPKRAYQTMEIFVPQMLEENKGQQDQNVEKQVSLQSKDRRKASVKDEMLEWYTAFGKKWLAAEKTKDVHQADRQGVFYGIAVDLGTTNLELLLWDRTHGTCLQRCVCENRQRQFGSDVVSRLTYSSSPDGFREMCNCLQTQVFEEIKCLLGQAQVMELEKLDAVINSRDTKKIPVYVTGNAVMMHFFAGQSIDSLLKAPYHSDFTREMVMEGEEIGLPMVTLYLLPNIESFVGADTLAILYGLVSGALEVKPETDTLGVDIGTNGEIFLMKGDSIFVTSTAAGPAFEGASISCGMAAKTGAIIGVQDTPSSQESVYSTIGGRNVWLDIMGGKSAEGICGSGLISLVGFLYEKEWMDATGLLLKGQEGKTGKTLVIMKRQEGDLVLEQRDIRELQMAKAAIATGIECLLEASHTKLEEVSQCILAGAFGTHLDVHAGKTIGLLPNIENRKMIPVGNAALLGASNRLWDCNGAESMRKIQERIIHVPLADTAHFQEQFIKHISFPK